MVMNYSEKENRRKQPRYNVQSRVRFTVHADPVEKEGEGFMLNLSSAGLCITAEKPLQVGQEISITECVASFCCRKYEVQWVRQGDEQFATYMAGLMSPEYKLLH
jgi:hypothetical protein